MILLSENNFLSKFRGLSKILFLIVHFTTIDIFLITKWGIHISKHFNVNAWPHFEKLPRALMKRIVSKEQTITTHLEKIKMFIAFLLPDLFVWVEQNKLLKQMVRL